MKIIYLNGKEREQFWITNHEFSEAINAWNSNIPYWCKRLEVLIPKQSIYFAEKKKDVRYFHIKTGVMYEKRKDGFHYSLSKDEELAIPLDKQNPDEFETEDEYYDNQKLLK